MGEIILAGVPVEIGLQVGQGGHGPPVVEGLARVGQDQYQLSARAEHPPPFAQGGDGIGHVLEAMGGEDKIVASLRDAAEVGGFAQELPAGRAAVIEAEIAAVAQIGFPSCDAGEVHIVDAGGVRIGRKNSPAEEDIAGSADLEAGPVQDCGANRRSEGGTSRPEAVVDRRGEGARIGVAQPAVVVLETGEGGHAGFVAAAGWGGEIFVRSGTRARAGRIDPELRVTCMWLQCPSSHPVPTSAFGRPGDGLACR